MKHRHLHVDFLVKLLKNIFYIADSHRIKKIILKVISKCHIVILQHREEIKSIY